MSISLKSSDDQIFEVDLKTAMQSMTIKTMLEDLGFTDIEEDEPIPLPNVNSTILKAVIDWCTRHKDDPPFMLDENIEKRSDNITEWDRNFMDVDNNFLFELILAANYLDIKGLLDLGCKSIANMIKGKTPDEIRRTFNLKEKVDFSDEEQITNDKSDGDEAQDVKEASKKDEITKIKYQELIKAEKENVYADSKTK